MSSALRLIEGVRYTLHHRDEIPKMELRNQFQSCLDVVNALQRRCHDVVVLRELRQLKRDFQHEISRIPIPQRNFDVLSPDQFGNVFSFLLLREQCALLCSCKSMTVGTVKKIEAVFKAAMRREFESAYGVLDGREEEVLQSRPRIEQLIGGFTLQRARRINDEFNAHVVRLYQRGHPSTSWGPGWQHLSSSVDTAQEIHGLRNEQARKARTVVLFEKRRYREAFEVVKYVGTVSSYYYDFVAKLMALEIPEVSCTLDAMALLPEFGRNPGRVVFVKNLIDRPVPLVDEAISVLDYITDLARKEEAVVHIVNGLGCVGRISEAEQYAALVRRHDEYLLEARNSIQFFQKQIAAPSNWPYQRLKYERA